MWDDGTQVVFPAMGAAGWARAVVKIVAIAVIIFGLMGPMVLCRLVGLKQVSQGIVGLASRAVIWVIGLSIVRVGSPMIQRGAVVANHCSWLDIFVLNAVQKVLFVAKSEVQHWPLIGVIARSVGTVFIERKQTQAVQHLGVVQRYISEGWRLLFFPEGTSTDGRRVVRFKSSLFAAFFDEKLRETIWIQPVTVIYSAPEGVDERLYGWWGDASFAPHFFAVLGLRRQGRVEVVFHPPIRPVDVTDRKVLARQCEDAVRGALADALEVGR